GRRPSVAFRLFKAPSDEDFRNYRYRKPLDLLVCRYEIDAAQGRFCGVEYDPEGLELLCRKVGADSPVAAADLPLLLRFPLQAELERVLGWCNGVPRGPEVDPVIGRIAKHVQASAALLAQPAVDELVRRVALDWEAGGAPPAGGPWRLDLALARRYYQDVFDE